MMNRTYLITGVALLVVAGIVAYAWQGKVVVPKARTTITVGQYYWPGQYWVDVADAKGWFKEAGLDVKLINTNADYKSSLEQVVNGTLDTQNFWVFDLMDQVSKGADLAMVLNADTSIGAEGIVARAGISAIQDLQNKRIGVEQDIATAYILDTLLQQNKLSESDVVLVYARSEDLPEMLQAGEIDALVAWEPIVTKALEVPGSRKIWDTSQTPGIISAGYVFRRDFIESRPDEVKKFVAVWDKTTKYIAQNPDDAYAIVARYQNDTPENVTSYTAINKALNVTDNLKAFSYSGGVRSLYSQIKLINSYFLSKNKITTGIEPAKILESRFIQELGLNQ